MRSIDKPAWLLQNVGSNSQPKTRDTSSARQKAATARQPQEQAFEWVAAAAAIPPWGGGKSTRMYKLLCMSTNNPCTIMHCATCRCVAGNAGAGKWLLQSKARGARARGSVCHDTLAQEFKTVSMQDALRVQDPQPRPGLQACRPKGLRPMSMSPRCCGAARSLRVKDARAICASWAKTGVGP